MSTTQPIRSKQLLHDFKNYYLTEQPEFRNYTIILIGLNTALRINDVIRCHSLRKTFGYHAWKMGTPPALLMEIYNHSSFQITKHYLGIEQDDKDAVFRDIQL